MLSAAASGSLALKMAFDRAAALLDAEPGPLAAVFSEPLLASMAAARLADVEPRAQARCARALWASPERASSHAIIDELTRRLVPSALLVVLRKGEGMSLSRVRCWGRSPNVDADLLSAGFRLVRRHCFGGPAMFAYAAAARAASAAGRPDLVDRCEAAYRLDLGRARTAARPALYTLSEFRAC